MIPLAPDTLHIALSDCGVFDVCWCTDDVLSRYVAHQANNLFEVRTVTAFFTFYFYLLLFCFVLPTCSMVYLP